MKKTFLAATILSMLSFVACKPTESNYKAAYDAAQQKETGRSKRSGYSPALGGLKNLDGPTKRDVNGDSVYVVKQHLKFVGGLKRFSINGTWQWQPTRCLPTAPPT